MGNFFTSLLLNTMFVIEDTDNSKTVCCVVAFLFVFILLIFSICWTTNKDSFENFTDVVKYNNDTIKNVLKGGLYYKSLGPRDDAIEFIQKKSKKHPVLVTITAPWCGYCRQLKDSGILTRVAKKYTVVDIDDKHPQVTILMKLLKSEGFPTLAIAYRGELHPYKGPREHVEKVMDGIMSKREEFGYSGFIMDAGDNYGLYQKKLKGLSKGGQKVCTLFTAPWCGHCKNLEQSQLPQKLAELGFAVFRADDNSEITKKMNIQGFPSIYCVKNNKNTKYEGERTVAGILEFVSK